MPEQLKKEFGKFSQDKNSESVLPAVLTRSRRTVATKEELDRKHEQDLEELAEENRKIN